MVSPLKAKEPGNRDLRKEVESHSSQITNQRIGQIKDAVWKMGLEVMASKPHPISRIQFFSVLLEYYLEAKDICDHEDLIKIEQRIMAGNRIAARWRATGKFTGAEMENLLQITLSLQSMLNSALQKYRYFFRLGKHDPKGIDQALKIFGENIWEEKDGQDTAIQAKA